MVQTELEYVNCNLCSSNDTDFLFLRDGASVLMGKRRFPEKEQFRLVRCKKCGFVYVNPRPRDTESHYVEEYHLSNKLLNTKFGDFIYYIYYKLFRRIPFHNKDGGRILDLGCGIGRYSRMLKKQGWQTFGVDINAFVCEYAQKKLNLDNIFCGDLIQANYPDKYFDVVTLWSSVNHIYNPLEIFKEAHRILKKDGMIVLGDVPNFDSFEFRIFGVYNALLSVPYHLYHFTPDTLSRMLKKAGFNIAKISYDFPLPASLSWSLINLLEDRTNCKVKIETRNRISFALYPLFLPINLILNAVNRGATMKVWARKNTDNRIK